MSLQDVLTFSLVASLLVMSPGPNGVLIAKTVPTSGRAAGFANVAGFVAAFYLHGALSVLGISLLLAQSATAFTIVKYLGAAYLTWIGIKSLLAATRDLPAPEEIQPSRRRRPQSTAFLEGFLTNALNPKVSMFYLAAFPQFVSVGDASAWSSFALVAIHSAINAIWFSAMVMLVGQLAGWTSSARAQRILKGTIGAIFIGFGLKLASYQRA